MLYILRGTSCSGKDTFCRNFSDDAVISSDKFRVMLTGSVNQQRVNRRVFELIHEVVQSRVEERVKYTVVNATHLSIKDIRFYLDLQKIWKFKIKVISIIPPSINELIKRRDNRIEGSLTPNSVLMKHLERYENCKPAFINEENKNELFTFNEVSQEALNELLY